MEVVKVVQIKGAKEIAQLFADRLNDDDIISYVFDQLEFDCTAMCFVEPNLLDAKIRNFCEHRSIDNLASIIELIIKGIKSVGMSENTLLQEAENYIDAHLTENFSIEQMAKDLYVSYFYLCHLFKKVTGKSVLQYRTYKRLEKAVRMLLETEVSISVIASSCGFDSFSYFSERFAKYLDDTPSHFRLKYSHIKLLPFYRLEDIILATKMADVRLIDDNMTVEKHNGGFMIVQAPSDEFVNFAHEVAIIEYNGVLYASWYSCKESELVGCTSIVSKRSYDKGKTWTDVEIITEINRKRTISCPPVYGISDGMLYMLVNRVTSEEQVYLIDLYRLNNETDKFEFVWSKNFPFKLCTNVMRLPDGKLMITGRGSETESYPAIPAVMISDSGKIEGQWRVVKVTENSLLPDGEKILYPDTSAICHDNKIYLFARNDLRRVPLLYISDDFGESWSEAIGHDIPCVCSKAHCGTLKDGRNYFVANVDRFDRSKLVLYLSEKGEMRFTKQVVLSECLGSGDDTAASLYPSCVDHYDQSKLVLHIQQSIRDFLADAESLSGEADKENGITASHYPSCVEFDGTLYIIAIGNYIGKEASRRGVILYKIDLNNV